MKLFQTVHPEALFYSSFKVDISISVMLKEFFYTWPRKLTLKMAHQMPLGAEKSIICQDPVAIPLIQSQPTSI